MGRGKIEIKKIENVNSRQITFSKRRSGLMKKAKELSILCDADIGVIIFSSTGKLYEFSNSRMEQIIARYNKCPDASELPSVENVSEHDAQPEVDALKMEIAKLEKVYRRMMGKELDDLNFKELQHLEHQLHEGIISVKDRKEQVLLEQLEKSRLQEQKAKVESETLREQIAELRRNATTDHVSRPIERRNSFASSSIVSHPRSEKERDSDTSLCLGPAGDAYQRRKIPKLEWGSNDLKSHMVSP